MSAEPRARWGFHELTDRWAQRVVDCASIRSGDLVVDVGAGRGALTSPLVARGARVVAVELHPQRAQELRERFDRAPVVVVHADASDLRLPRRPFHVVANPPFAITTALFKRLLSPGSRLVSATLVVPLYAAHQWSTGRDHGAGRWTRTFSVHIVQPMPRAAFRPAPPGRVAMLRITRRGA